MTSHLKKVRSGDPLRIPAATYNAFVDAAEDLRQRQHLGGQQATPFNRQPGAVLARNRTKLDQPQFAALWLAGVALHPSTHLQRFRNTTPLFELNTWASLPATQQHEQRFAILQEPVKSGKLGRALLAGVSPVQLTMTDPAHGYALPNPDDPQTMRSAWTGACRILWREGGAGLQWAVVQFPVNDAPRLRLRNDSGVPLQDGYACLVTGTPAPWTLTVEQPSGDSQLPVIAYEGPELLAGETATLHRVRRRTRCYSGRNSTSSITSADSAASAIVRRSSMQRPIGTCNWWA